MNADNKLNIASIQMVSGIDVEPNLDKAETLIKEAAASGADVVVLPEFFLRIADASQDKFKGIVEDLGIGPIQNRLARIAHDNNIHLIAGSIPIRSAAEKCFNTTLIYDNSGKLVTHYHKIHLFKFIKKNINFDEGKIFNPGKDIVTFNIRGFKLGIGICYDLRFPEMFRLMGQVDAIILPAAFLHHTGQHHWEILLRARAIENQCYVVASGQGGIHENGRHTFGHSMIIDPWGRIESFLENGDGVVCSEISKAHIHEIRSQLPALDNRVF